MDAAKRGLNGQPGKVQIPAEFYQYLQDVHREWGKDRARLNRTMDVLARCVGKLAFEYHRQQPDAPVGESWAEGEAGQELLDLLRSERPDRA